MNPTDGGSSEQILRTLEVMSPDRRSKYLEDLKEEQKSVRHRDVKEMIVGALEGYTVKEDTEKMAKEVLRCTEAAFSKIEASFKAEIDMLRSYIQHLENQVLGFNDSNAMRRKRGRFGKTVASKTESIESASLITNNVACMFCMGPAAVSRLIGSQS